MAQAGAFPPGFSLRLTFHPWSSAPTPTVSVSDSSPAKPVYFLSNLLFKPIQTFKRMRCLLLELKNISTPSLPLLSVKGPHFLQTVQTKHLRHLLTTTNTLVFSCVEHRNSIKEKHVIEKNRFKRKN